MTDPYREETPDGWADLVAQTWKVEDVTEGMRLFGACPTCRHPSETRVLVVTMAPGATPQSGAPQSGAKTLDLSRPEPVLVVCDCAEDHDGRPAGRTGCGRAGYLELVAEQP